MNMQSYQALTSEISMLDDMLRNIPSGNVIERIGLEHRLKTVRAKFDDIQASNIIPVQKAKLTFNGRPVLGSHGISADFAAKATGMFTDAVSAIAASLQNSLSPKGPIPNKDKNQLLITGVAVGSFGFEFELPQSESPDLFPEPSHTEEAMESVQQLFRLSASGSDDEVTEIVERIHPRAVKKVAEFLECLAQSHAWCGLEVKDNFFKYDGLPQIEASISRIQEGNIHGSDVWLKGKFLGALPSSGVFEFQTEDIGVIKGRLTGSADTDANAINFDWLKKSVRIEFHVIQVGQGKPRYSLVSLDTIQLA